MKKNRRALFLSGLLAGILMLSQIPVFAGATEEPISPETEITAPTLLANNCGESATWAVSEGGTLTISGTGAMEDYANASDAPWYSQKDSITAVVVERGITVIGARAFYNFTNLTQVSIGDTVTTINTYAFRGCTALTEITIPDSVTAINGSAFRASSNLAVITFEGNAPTLGDNVFTDCPSTMLVQYYEGATGFDLAPWTTYTQSALHVGQWVVDAEPTCTTDGSRHIDCSYCNTTITEVIPGGHTYVDGVCSVCDHIEILAGGTFATSLSWELNALGQLTISGTGAMTDYTSSNYTTSPWYTYRESVLTLVLENGITNVGDYAFYGCTTLTDVSIPASVTTIGTYGFKNCSSIAELTIPDTVTTIKSAAFSGCAGLVDLTIPFVGKEVTSRVQYWQYPLGFIFGTSSYTGGTATNQYYYGSSTSSTTSNTYYIPTSLRSVTVTGGNILRGAFYNCSNLTSIAIPNNTTLINEYAFYNCSSLADFSLPQNLHTVKEYTFYGCAALTEMVLPENVTEIGNYAFYGCSGLTTLTVPESVTSIGSYAFYNCSGVATINIPEEVTAIGDYTFYGCSSLTSVSIGVNVTTIGNSAFRGCSSLEEVEVPDSVTSIGSGAFGGCASLESITVPFVGGSVKTASDTDQYPFGYIFGTSSYTGGTATTQYYYGSSTSSTTSNTYYIPTSLRSVTVTGGNILRGAFYNCSNLTSITIPDDITAIGGYAFYSCTNLADVNIPEEIENVGYYAFYGCAALTEMVLPETTTEIGGYAFYGCSGLTTLTIPDSVATIGEYAFYNCSGVTSINIPEAVTAIADRTFYGCSGLTTVTISENVISIGSHAFWGCSSLEEVEVPGSVTSIGVGAFGGCASLESITVPFVGDSVKTASDTYQYPFGYIFGTSSYTGGTSTLQYYYGSSATSTTYSYFYIPTSLRSVTVTGGNVLYGAFYNCSNLTSIVVPDDVTDIGSYAFYNCTNLADVNIPQETETVGNYAFYGCTALTEVTLPDSTTSIGTYAFYNCSGLTSFNIPEEVTSIGTNTFCGCSGLTSVTICDNVTSIGDYAFKGCSSLVEVVVPDSVTTIGQGAFGGCASLESITIPFVGGSVKTASDTYQNPFGFIFGTSSYTGGTSTLQYYYGGSTTSTSSSYFYIPTALKSVTVTGGNILYGAFYNCNNLTSVTLLGNMTSLTGYAFYGCTSLKAVLVPASVTSVGDYAFYNCTNLEHVFYRGTEEQKAEIPVSTYNGGFWDALWHYEVTDALYSGRKIFCCGTCDRRYYPDGSLVPIAELEILTLPDNLNCAVNGSIDLEGIELEGAYSDGTTIALTVDDVEDVSADMSEIGVATATVTALGATAEFDVYVHNGGNVLVDSSEYPESAHNYSNSTNNTQTFTYPGALSLTITFSTSTSVESNYDNIYVYDGSGTQIAHYTGTAAAGVTLTIPGNSFSIKLTSDGSVTHYGYSFSSIYANTGELIHPPVIDPATATCTEPGLTEGSHCEICDMVLVAQEQVESLGHDYVAVVTDPTCTEDGYTTNTCSRCADSYVDSQVTSPGHAWVDADCLTPKTCRRCQTTEGEALGHEYEAVVTEPTCTAGGYTTHICIRCSESYVDTETDPTGHDWQEANCASPRTCRNCGLTEGSIGTHNYEPVVTEPTCTEGGYTTHTCPGCGDSYVDSYTNPIGHSWVEVTCTEPRHCRNCNLTDGDPLGHNYESFYLEPTCTEDGGTGVRCTNCGDYTFEEVIPATGHEWEEASCTTPETCRNCDETRGEALPHTYTDSVTPPTCTEDGYTTHTCTVCGYSYNDTAVPALGHSWVDATCTVAKYCSVCNVTDGDPLGHNFVGGECTRCHEEGSAFEGVIRLAGANRYATGFAIANQLKVNLGVNQFQAVVVAYGLNFPDALTGSYLAAVKNAPILLTDPTVDGEVIAYLQQNLVAGGQVYILGGEAAVSKTFEVAAQSLGYNVKRLKGAGRYETNLEILKEAGVNTTDEVLIATGKNYADSLSASATGLPMLLVDQTLTDSQREFLQNTSKKFVILGGSGAVSEQIEAELGQIGNVIRLKGSNRYLTSVVIARRYFPNAQAAVLAYAQGFPDGLCGGPLALSMNAPLILTSNESFDAADSAVQNISAGAVTGGTGRISDETVREIFDLPADTPIPRG